MQRENWLPSIPAKKKRVGYVGFLLPVRRLEMQILTAKEASIVDKERWYLLVPALERSGLFTGT